MQLPQSLLIVIALEVLMPLSAFAAAVLFAVPILAVERQPRWLCPNPQGPNHILDLRVLCHLHFLAAGLRRGRSCSTRPALRAALLGPRAAAHNKSARCTKHRCHEAQSLCTSSGPAPTHSQRARRTLPARSRSASCCLRRQHSHAASGRSMRPGPACDQSGLVLRASPPSPLLLILGSGAEPPLAAPRRCSLVPPLATAIAFGDRLPKHRHAYDHPHVELLSDARRPHAWDR